MSTISDLVSRIKNIPGCSLAPTSTVSFSKKIPPDLREFYSLCGGAKLFNGSDYSISIVGPDGLKPSNELILGEQFPEDRSSSWCVIAECSPREYISIDMSIEKSGWCYDSFHEVHGIAGSCPVISKSFSELLLRIIDNRGERYFWLKDYFKSYGDAYDN